MKWTILIITLIELHLVRSQISLTLNQLLKDTLTNYDKRTRPFEHEQPLIFSIRLTEAVLVKLDSEAQTVSFNIAQYLKWQDPRLVWDPAKYDNISQFYIPASSIWMPKIYFYNSVPTSSSSSLTTSSQLSDPDALILSNGNITVYLETFINCASDVYMDRFPFDTQYMFIGQSPSLLSIQEMDAVVIEPPPLDEGYFKGNSEFDLISVTSNYGRNIEAGITQFEIDYVFALQRKNTYYTTVIVIPVFLSLIINAFGVFSPGTSKGENVKIALTTFFSLVVLLGIVANDMPKSNSMSVIGIYILVMLCLCAISINISIFLRMIEEMLIKHKYPAPNLLRKIFFVRENKKIKSKANGDSNIRIDLDNKRIYTITKVNGVNYASSHQKNEIEAWETIFERTRYFLLILFQLFNIINLLLYSRYYWLPPQPMPTTFEYTSTLI